MECGRDSCTCQVLEPGEFCSETCELGTVSGPFCGCDHAVCRASRAGATVM